MRYERHSSPIAMLHALRAHAAEDIVYVRYERQILADGFVGMLIELQLAKGKVCMRYEFHPLLIAASA